MEVGGPFVDFEAARRLTDAESHAPELLEVFFQFLSLHALRDAAHEEFIGVGRRRPRQESRVDVPLSADEGILHRGRKQCSDVVLE